MRPWRRGRSGWGGCGHSYRVLSDGKLGRSYAVEPHTWSCDCPDSRRRESACKHAIAA